MLAKESQSLSLDVFLNKSWSVWDRSAQSTVYSTVAIFSR